jgi:hypothetical protein
MTIRDEIRLNRVVQGLEPLEAFMVEFDQAAEERKRDLLRDAVRMALQAGRREGDVASAIASSGVKPRRTSAIVLGLPSRESIWRLTTLPKAELNDAMRLLLALFEIADSHRRSTSCRGACTHWWHGDLSDVEATIAAVEAPSIFSSRKEPDEP